MTTEKGIIGYIKSTELQSDEEQRIAAAETIADFLRAEDPLPEAADVIFIIGGDSPTMTQVTKGAELYEHYKGAAKVVMVCESGANTTDSGIEEHAKFRQKLVELGVPDDDIVSQGLARNSLQEAQQALPFMKEHGINPKTVVLTSIPVHARRVAATWRHVYGDELNVVLQPGDEKFDPSDSAQVERAIREVRGLRNYERQGNLAHTDRPIAVLKATALLRNYSYHQDPKKNKGLYEFPAGIPTNLIK